MVSAELGRILVVRPDRLGDVVLSTPVLEALRRNFPQARISFMIQDALAPIFRGLDTLDEVVSARHESGIKGVAQLSSRFRAGSFDAAIVLQSRWEIAAALAVAGVKRRIGPRSKPHSYLFYRPGIRQRRSRVEMHEADYNLELLKPLGIHIEPKSLPVRVSVPDLMKAAAKEWLQAKGWKPGMKLIAVHPGMGGSALNWPERNYIELVRNLLREGMKVLVTSGPTEAELVNRVAESLGGRRETAILYSGREVKGLDFLGGLLAHADLVVAPSTGPLHLAVALGKRVVTFYPRIPVQSPKRWGPYLADETRASVLVPHVYSEMNSITLEETLEQVRLQLAKGP